MKQISQFLADHNISSHSIVSGFAMLSGFLAYNDQARAALFAFLEHHQFLSLLFSFATFSYVTYRGSHSAQGISKLLANGSTSKPEDVAPQGRT